MLKFLLAGVLVGIISLTNGSNFDLPEIVQLTEPVDVAEVPSWDGRKNILFFADVHNGKVFSYNYDTKRINSITLNGSVAPVIPASSSDFLIVGLDLSVVLVDWDGSGPLRETKVLSTVSQQFPTSNLNDGKADKNGNLWLGTMGAQGPNGISPDEGVFYKFTKTNLENPTVEIAPVNISNGIAWNAANDQLFYIDSNTLQVAGYDFDLENGSISNRRVVFDVTDHPDLTGVPDGMTIDENDDLWVALLGGGSIIHVNSTTGELLQRIALPAKHVTSAMWGGPDLDILFVTTARALLTEEEKLFYPAAGSVFAISNLKTKGLPMFYADILKC